jgi:hypothetical protein
MAKTRLVPEAEPGRARERAAAPADRPVPARPLRAADVLALQRTLGNAGVQRRVQAAAGPGAIHRKIAPARSEEAEPQVPTSDLQAAYNQAWRYLWGSENARKVYGFVDGLEVTVPIEVGSTDSDAEAARVSWNPREANLQLNQPGLPGQAAEGGPKIAADQIVGQSSSAITLLHELGHVRQHQQARQNDEEAKGSSGDLAELIRVATSTPAPTRSPSFTRRARAQG